MFSAEDSARHTRLKMGSTACSSITVVDASGGSHELQWRTVLRSKLLQDAWVHTDTRVQPSIQLHTSPVQLWIGHVTGGHHVSRASSISDVVQLAQVPISDHHQCLPPDRPSTPPPLFIVRSTSHNRQMP